MTTWIAAHLWQSTLVVGVAALVAHALRANHARTRHFVWLAASMKFLVPFGALVAVGRQFAWRRAPLTIPDFLAAATAGPFPTTDSTQALSALPTPLTLPDPGGALLVNVPTLLTAIWAVGTLVLLATWAGRWWTVRRILHAARPVSAGRELRILREVQAVSGCYELSLRISDSTLEPGIVGCVNPVILWPADISQRLSDDQIAAVLMHEVTHAKRRDNLSGLAHMAVQAVFWFHPLVWWVGARLVDERERACDEEVVQLGADPHLYAESILRTCEYAVESPLVCVAGVTGADLKRRIVAIVNARPSAPLGGVKLALLTIVGILVAAGPIAAGALTYRLPEATEVVSLRIERPRSAAAADERYADRPRRVEFVAVRRTELPLAADQTSQVSTPAVPVTTAAGPVFEVASVKLDTSPTEGPVSIRLASGVTGRVQTAASVRALILQAYQIPFVRQIGGPDWIRQDIYHINAKAPDDVESTPENVQAMMRALLADRFKLVAHEEEREVPLYTLSLNRADGKLGPRIQPSTCPPRGSGQPPTLPPNQAGLAWERGPRCGQMGSGRGMVQLGGFSIAQLTDLLQSTIGQPVVDRTGLAGDYVLELTFSPQALSSGPGDSDAPSIFTAVQEQLGLKLESRRGPVKVLVIDSIQRPTDN